MKIDETTLKSMEADIKIMINYFGLTPSQMNVYDIGNVWFHVFMNKNYPDNNPNVKKDAEGLRILPYIENFELYPCDTNDTTIYTAFNKILKSLQL